MSYIYSKNSLDLPDDITHLIFWGNEVDSTYSFKGIRGSREMGVAVVLSGGYMWKEIENFAFGAGIKYLYGISYMGISDSYGHLTTTFYESDNPKIYGEGGIVYEYADGGYGLGIDLGLLYFRGNFTFSLSIINAFAEMVWHENARRVETRFKLSPMDLETFDPQTSLKWSTEETGDRFITYPEPHFNANIAIKKEHMWVTLGTGYPQLLSAGIELTYGVIALRSGGALVEGKPWVGVGIGILKKGLHLDLGIRASSSSHFSGAFSFLIIP
jgi:hypothetical protein